MKGISENTKRIMVRTNWDMGVIEHTLREHIGNCEIWGDLDISFDEYMTIKSKISDKLSPNPTTLEIRLLLKNYPVTMVTDMINFILFEYDNNDFWSSWANRFNLCLAANNQVEIGIIIHEIFNNYKFEITEDGGYKYVTPILSQAGIPCACLNKLFDILDSTLNLLYFDEMELVNELRGYRSYLIDAPVERYFRLHTERAIDLIAGIRAMMHSLGRESFFENDSLPSFEGIEMRIVKQYSEWRSAKNNRKHKSRISEQYFNPPKIVYDNCKGICIFIPEQVLQQDMIYKLQWDIKYNDIVTTGFSQVYSAEGRNYTNNEYIPVGVSDSYSIELYDADDNTKLLTSAWMVKGIDEGNPVLVFGENGALLSHKYISRKGTVFVFDSCKTKISDKYGIQELIEIDLTQSWSNAKAFKVYPAEKRAYIAFNTNNKELKLECRHNFDIELVQVGTLFKEKFCIGEIPVFTNTPVIEISRDVEGYKKSSFDNWQVLIIHRLSNKKYSFMLSEIEIYDYPECFRFSLPENKIDFFNDLYGFFEMKVFDGKMKYNIPFYIAPFVEYSEINENVGTELSLFNQEAGFYFKYSNTFRIEFEKDVKIKPALEMGPSWNKAYFETGGAFVKGLIEYEYSGTKYKIPFKKTVRKLQWQFWNETKNEFENYGVKLFYSNEIKDKKWRLALQFTDEINESNYYKIVLQSKDGKSLQSEELVIDMDGKSIVTINLFQDTIVGNKLPQRLMLYISNADGDFLLTCLAVIRNYVELSNPRLTIKKEKPIIYWDKANDFAGKKLRLISLTHPDSEVIEFPLEDIRDFSGKEGTYYEGIIINQIIPDGVYRIDAIENEEGFFLEDYTGNTIYTFEKERILYVNAKQLLENLIKKEDTLLYEWLSASIVALYKFEWIDIIANRIKNELEKRKLDFDIKKCTSLIFFLFLVTNDKSNLDDEIKSKVIDICEMVNLWCITDNDRIEILKQLINSDINNSDCQLIIGAFQLYLFKPNKCTMFDRHSMQRLWELNENIAVLVNIRKCVEDVGTDILRVATYINYEVFEKIIKFLPENSCQTSEWLDCFENALSGRCSCDKFKFECTDRVWGNGFEWANLFANIKNKYKFELITPDESHTKGYEIMGINYLTLIYRLITKKSDDSVHAENEALKDSFKIENLIQKYNPLFADINEVLRKREGAGTGAHKLFYFIGAAAILNVLASNKKIEKRDLLELLPFWKNAMKAYPELVYRDLITAELNILFDNERGKDYDNESNRNNQNY